MSAKFFLMNVSTGMHGTQFAKISPEDAERVLLHKWAYGFGGSRKKGTLFYVGNIKTGERLHRYLLQAPRGVFVDHADCDPLNNTRENLRLASGHQNGGNSRKLIGKASQFKGVCWHSQSKKWRAYISPHGKQISLGLFDVEIEAARAYDRKTREIFGSFARVNLPGPGEAHAI